MFQIPYKPFTLYRRDKLIIREEFNDHNTDPLETSINENVLLQEMNVPAQSDGGVNAFSSLKNLDYNGQPYYSAYADRSCSLNISMEDWRIPIICGGKTPQFFEFKFDAGVFGPGALFATVTNEKNIVNFSPSVTPQGLVEKFYGPCSWQISDYHLFCPGQWMQFLYCVGGRADPLPRCEIDNVVFYPYYPLTCEFKKLGTGKTDTTPKKVSVLRGYNAYQTTTRISALFECSLRFFDKESHTDFVVNAEQPHVLCDEKGVLYRGVIELADCDNFGPVYEQNIKFHTSCKLGVGWK